MEVQHVRREEAWCEMILNIALSSKVILTYFGVGYCGMNFREDQKTETAQMSETSEIS
jgi:hypothetical protein